MLSVATYQPMTHAPSILTLSHAAFNLFLGLLPQDRITRAADRITVHADSGDAVWYLRGNRWLTTAPGDDTARRFGAQGPVQ